MIYKIAIRNIIRHRRRTLTSALTIGIGLMFFILMDSIMSGMDRGAIDNMINLSLSAVKIRTHEYVEEQKSFPLKYGLSNPQQIRRAILRIPAVKGATKRTSFVGSLSNYEQSVPVVGTVIDPGTDSTVFSLGRHVQGSYLSADGIREIILGAKLAEDLGVDVGDYITLFALTKFDARNADEFEVVGLINTTDPTLNRSTVVISYTAANDLLDLEGMVTEIDVAVESRVNLDDFLRDIGVVKNKAKSLFPDLAASSFMDLGAGFLEVSRQKRGVTGIIVGVILLIAAVGIFNTVLMSVYERIREVGVLRAHGMKSGEITRMFVLEGLMTGVLGSVLGLVLGLAVNWYLVVYGYPIDKIAGDIDIGGFPIWGTIYGQWNFETLLFAFVFGIVVAILAGLIPARKAGKMEVTRALRFV